MDRRLGPAGFALGILLVSLVPVPESGGDLPVLLGVALDKWVHAAGYAALVGLCAWGTRRRDVPAVAAAVAAVAVYGAGIECLQWVAPTRDPSALDALANAVGALCGGAGWLLVADWLGATDPPA